MQIHVLYIDEVSPQIASPNLLCIRFFKVFFQSCFIIFGTFIHLYLCPTIVFFQYNSRNFCFPKKIFFHLKKLNKQTQFVPISFWEVSKIRILEIILVRGIQFQKFQWFSRKKIFEYLYSVFLTGPRTPINEIDNVFTKKCHFVGCLMLLVRRGLKNIWQFFSSIFIVSFLKYEQQSFPSEPETAFFTCGSSVVFSSTPVWLPVVWTKGEFC